MVGRAHNETVAEAAGIVITKKENGSSFIIHIQPLLMCPYSSYFPGAAYLPPPFCLNQFGAQIAMDFAASYFFLF